MISRGPTGPASLPTTFHCVHFKLEAGLPVPLVIIHATDRASFADWRMHLPHLKPFRNASIVFITTCTHKRESRLACPEVHEALHDIWTQSAELNGWFVGHYVLMPDHIHLFACPGRDALPLAGWMQIWKSIAAKRINRAFERTGTLWQADYFDRCLRSLKDYSQKWDYVALNPVRKGLVARPEDWSYSGTIHHLCYHASRD